MGKINFSELNTNVDNVSKPYGVVCPICSSFTIMLEESETEDTYFRRNGYQCADCNAVFSIIYATVGYKVWRPSTTE